MTEVWSNKLSARQFFRRFGAEGEDKMVALLALLAVLFFVILAVLLFVVKTSTRQAVATKSRFNTGAKKPRYASEAREQAINEAYNA